MRLLLCEISFLARLAASMTGGIMRDYLWCITTYDAPCHCFWNTYTDNNIVCMAWCFWTGTSSFMPSCHQEFPSAVCIMPSRPTSPWQHAAALSKNSIVGNCRCSSNITHYSWNFYYIRHSCDDIVPWWSNKIQQTPSHPGLLCPLLINHYKVHTTKTHKCQSHYPSLRIHLSSANQARMASSRQPFPALARPIRPLWSLA